MDTEKYCQSCCMPLDYDHVLGTESDGSPSHEYCKYCYQNGAFINPEMTLDEMKAMDRRQMELRHIPEGVIAMTLAMLPALKRWRSSGTSDATAQRRLWMGAYYL
jgi:hypothetical protein